MPRDNRDDYDKENIDFQILSPQPQRDFFLPKMQRYRDKGKKTLVLDLDETLVHSTFDKWSDPDITLTVNFEGKENNIYVKIRPGAINFLQRIHKYYEVVIFTASVANYADPLIDILDVDKYSFFKLFREHCTYNGNYVKDLSKIGRDLKDCIIVDNLSKSYAFQPENGLPISSWYDNQADMELDKLYRLLIMLSKTKDVRNYINKIVVHDRISYSRVINIFQKSKEHSPNLRMLISINELEAKYKHSKVEKSNHNKNELSYNHRNKISQDENIDSTNNIKVNREYQTCITSIPNMQKLNYNNEPNLKHLNEEKEAQNIKSMNLITLEENYSQSKKFQKGTIELESIVQNPEFLLPTPSKSKRSMQNESSEKQNLKSKILSESNNISKREWENTMQNDDFNPFDTPKYTHFSDLQTNQWISLQANSKPTSVKVEQ